MSTPAKPIDYLVIGHITADLLPDGSVQPGGTALYAALTAHRLGLRTAILTACAPELDLGWLPPELQLLRKPAVESTTFSNRYSGQRRTQYLLHQAQPISLEWLPAEWEQPAIVHLGPVDQEVPMVARHFPKALVGATPQGWLRGWEADGKVWLQPQILKELDLRAIRVLVLSEEDIEGDETIIEELIGRVPTVVLTRAERGATTWQAGQRFDVPAFPTTVVDPTGAGDVFAAAFFMAMWQNKAVEVATRWANATASFSIAGQGTNALPTMDEVVRRMAAEY
ncbi:MAG: ribokinase [Herpetosiphonaceae bacterium]|nr:ribokinase [Herpetosiphonaceae bacterium]